MLIVRFSNSQRLCPELGFNPGSGSPSTDSALLQNFHLPAEREGARQSGQKRAPREAFMAEKSGQITSLGRMLAGFIAGFLATLIFHQLTVALFHGAGVSPFLPYSWTPTVPFGIPAVLSLSFWGGAWGIVFGLIHGRFPRGAGYWGAAFLFGAVLPSLVALLVVLPLKGRPLGGGWQLSLLLIAFFANGAWGIGTGVFLKSLKGWFTGSHGAGT